MVPYQFIERATPFSSKPGETLPVFAVTPAHIDQGAIDPIALDWAKKAGFKAEAGAILLIPSAEGALGGALLGLGTNPSELPFIAGKLARELPEGDWHIETAPLTVNRLALGFGLGAYRFDKYRAAKSTGPKLLIPRDAEDAEIKRVLAETGLEKIAAPEPVASSTSGAGEAASLLRPLAEQIAELERRAIDAAMASTGGNKLAASRLLGISRATLYDRMTTTG